MVLWCNNVLIKCGPAEYNPANKTKVHVRPD